MARSALVAIANFASPCSSCLPRPLPKSDDVGYRVRRQSASPLRTTLRFIVILLSMETLVMPAETPLTIAHSTRGLLERRKIIGF